MSNERESLVQISDGRPIGIFGAGVTARGIVQFLNHHAIPYELYDQNPSLALPFDEERARRHRLILCSPSFLSQHPWVQMAERSGCRCLQEFDFASRFTRAKLLGVTGTNGKTTTVAFLAHALRSLDRRSFTAGNIGQALSELLASECPPTEEDWVVCEISSTQAEHMRSTPLQALLWTNFAPNHLSEHGSLRRYFSAKYHLLSALETPQFFCGESVARHARKFRRALPDFTQICPPVREDPRWRKTVFELAPQRENIALIQAFWRQQSLPTEALWRAARSFRPLPYRLQRLLTRDKRTFWNDAKSTTFASTIAAFHQFPSPILWIGGGRDKGEPKEAFLREIRLHVAHAFLIGEEGAVLHPFLQKRGVAATLSGTLERALQGVTAHPLLEPRGDTVLFSPGYPSFDQFKNFAERGKTFEKLILGLS
ncbi:MAG: UDP-N-acetylmuramoyl-L-alanine--D-glutamate ligase [Puniceicoccales bacterium]|jgi:UDP-N-acetylmuramoylalanine--D-glutamate ligase|nr:UDP-N-acetylmuramoyl-L-alanine--D-glutamate ligase [Puniceicoccales bacterium]